MIEEEEEEVTPFPRRRLPLPLRVDSLPNSPYLLYLVEMQRCRTGRDNFLEDELLRSLVEITQSRIEKDEDDVFRGIVCIYCFYAYQ